MKRREFKKIVFFVLLSLVFIFSGCGKNNKNFKGSFVTDFNQDKIQTRFKFSKHEYEYSIIKSYSGAVHIIYQETGKVECVLNENETNQEKVYLVKLLKTDEKIYQEKFTNFIEKLKLEQEYILKKYESSKFEIASKNGKLIKMEKQNLLSNIFLVVIGGLGIFLLGMHYMSNGLQTVAGDRLRWLISKVTNNRIFAAVIGTFVTVIIQSSSITTVMVVGFVNAGIMTLKQSIGVIMGANIGTTITGWVLVVKIGKYGLPILGIAALFSLFCKKEKIKYIATIIMGLGMIFFGLELMTEGFKPIRNVPEFVTWFQMFSAETYFGVFKCILVGAILTMIVQSSSATLGITIGLAVTGVIPFHTAAALVLGENIGTTITAFLASFGANTSAKRAAYAHIVFNVLGCMWVFAIFPYYILFIEKITFNGSIGQQIATTHTIFNIANVILFLPFIGYIAKLLEKIVPEKQEVSLKLTKLDERMFETPVLVIDQTKREIINMANILKNMFSDLKDSILNNHDKNNQTIKNIFKAEEDLDIMQKEISTFLIELLAMELPHAVVDSARKYLSICDEYESISDYIMNISKLRLKLQDNGMEINEDKKNDILSMQEKVEQYFNTVNEYFVKDKVKIIQESIEINKNTTLHFKNLRSRHHERLSEIKIEPLLSTSYMDILNAYRRIKDHIFNMTEVLSGEKVM